MTPTETRKALGMSLNEFADAVGVTNRTIRRYEDGSRTPGEPTLRHMRRLLDDYHTEIRAVCRDLESGDMDGEG